MSKDRWEFIDETVFSIGQSYEDHPAKSIRCIKCGGTEFYVGFGNYYTAIYCPACKWETCVHEG